jgi:hypothetical protein
MSAFTENMAPSLVTTGEPRLNLFFKLVRNVIPVSVGMVKSFTPNQEDTIHLVSLIDDSMKIDKLDTLKILFNWRDCRGGKGDYWGFLLAMVHIIQTDYELFTLNAHLIPEYGRYRDFVCLWHILGARACYSEAPSSFTQARKLILNILVERLRTDIDLLKSDETKGDISLVAKWLPTEGGHWDDPEVELKDCEKSQYKESFCVSFCKSLFKVEEVSSLLLKRFRTEYLVPLRAHLQLVERSIVEKAFSNINYETVPSVAIKKYRKAYMRHDEERFKAYMDSVAKGESKINSSQVYPHDLIRPYLHGQSEDAVIEAQWKAIKEKVVDSGAFKDSMVVCDVSGSMRGTPMEVSIALGLMGMHKNRLITFSERPELHFVPEGSLHAQVNNVSNMAWGMNTDLCKVFDLLLNMTLSDHLEGITRLFIFSDMQFDEAVEGGANALFEGTNLQLIKKRYDEANLKMPQIVFWNLRGNTRDFPVRHDENGIVLMSGYSPSLLTALIENKQPSPLSILLDIIRAERYSKVRIP